MSFVHQRHIKWRPTLIQVYDTITFHCRRNYCQALSHENLLCNGCHCVRDAAFADGVMVPILQSEPLDRSPSTCAVIWGEASADTHVQVSWRLLLKRFVLHRHFDFYPTIDPRTEPIPSTFHVESASIGVLFVCTKNWV